MSVFKITDIKHPASADSNILLFGDGTTSIPGLLVDDVALGDLSDVDTAGQQNESVLAFDSSVGKWRPAAVPSLVAGVPTGTITMFGGGTAPAGWLNCDGGAVSRTTYADLFASVGTAYGAGDGSTTFNLPDLRLKFPRGVGSGVALGSSGGSAQHQHNVGGAHTHTITLTSGNHAHNHDSGNYSGNTSEVEDHRHSTNTNATQASIFTGTATSAVGQLTTTNVAANNHGHTVNSTTGTTSHNHGFSGPTVTTSVNVSNHYHALTAHNHTISEGLNGKHSHNSNVSGNSGGASSTTHEHTATAVEHTQDVTSGNGNNVPEYVAVNYIIKA